MDKNQIKPIYRCMQEDDRDYWVTLDGITDFESTVTAEYKYIEYVPSGRKRAGAKLLESTMALAFISIAIFS